MKPLEVTYISHACLRIEGDFGTLVCDPWILNEPIYDFTTWKFPAAIVPPEEVFKGVDYVYFSHPHEDHFHIPSIDHIPRGMRILLAEYTSNPGLRAQTMERTLREMGFHNIQKLMPWQTLRLGGSTDFTLIPACKMKYWDWENSGFVLEHPGCKILNMNDCPSDPELYAEVDRRFGEIDLGFIQYAGVSMFPGCYRMSETDMREAAKVRRASWVQQSNMVELLKVKRIAPFAGDFCWLDDAMYHCNWANRATPKLFEDFVRGKYGEKGPELVIMYPTDTWSPEKGLTRHHPDIDWSRYLESIDKVRDALAPKVKALRAWLDDNDMKNLEKRSRAYTEHMNRWLPEHGIDFSARVRFEIEGKEAGFSFVLKAAPGERYRFDWEDKAAVDQTLYVSQKLWAAILAGKTLMNNMQWASENQQHVEFRMEIARFWFWFETHIDLNNRNSQALIDRALHPQIEKRIRPQHGVFPLENEWNAPWLSQLFVLPAKRRA
jgi:L-ascorbate metabolism protein UlaG (beta-lactamase superfamily)